jgi:hypothetical protein
VYDQADFFHLDGYTRVQGLTPSQLNLEIYFNNYPQPWDLIIGTHTTDIQVTTGHVYWDDLGKLYGIRWRPLGVGYWRVLITYPQGGQILGQDYDVAAGTIVKPPVVGFKVALGSG